MTKTIGFISKKYIKKTVRIFIAVRMAFICVVCLFVSTLNFAQGKDLYVKSFGAKGDGKTNDTDAINAAVLNAAKNGSKLYFEKNKIYLIDTLSLRGTKTTPYKRLEIIGNNANIRCINKGGNNVLNFFFIDVLKITGLNILGNKSQKTTGNGLGVYYSKSLEITKCKIQDCKFIGILIAWVTSAEISGNLIFNNGDGSLPSDGIFVHSLYQGKITGNIIHNNNPLDTQDGDGIQIGSIQNSITGYYDFQSIKTIEVNNNICYSHGRRGIKIQRSNVVAEKNFLSDNAIGISVVNGINSVDNIKVTSNVIQKSYKGISLDGGGKQNISNVNISNNYFLGSIMTDGILLQDANGVKVTNNIFDKHRISVLDDKKRLVKYPNINVSSNVQNIDTTLSKMIDMHSSRPILGARPQYSKSSESGEEVLRNITAEITNYKPLKNNNVFCVFNNVNINKAKIIVIYNGKSKSYILNKNKILVIYSFKNNLLGFQY
jgi:hypothetical protein